MPPVGSTGGIGSRCGERFNQGSPRDFSPAALAALGGMLNPMAGRRVPAKRNWGCGTSRPTAAEVFFHRALRSHCPTSRKWREPTELPHHRPGRGFPRTSFDSGSVLRSYCARRAMRESAAPRKRSPAIRTGAWQRTNRCRQIFARGSLCNGLVGCTLLHTIAKLARALGFFGIGRGHYRRGAARGDNLLSIAVHCHLLLHVAAPSLRHVAACRLSPRHPSAPRP